MERAKPFLQGAALTSALLLAGGFVAYRAGAFNSVAVIEVQPLPGPVAETDAAPPSLSGSKPSFDLLNDLVNPPPPPATTPPGPLPFPPPKSTFLPSTKVSVGLFGGQ